MDINTCSSTETSASLIGEKSLLRLNSYIFPRWTVDVYFYAWVTTLSNSKRVISVLPSCGWFYLFLLNFSVQFHSFNHNNLTQLQACPKAPYIYSFIGCLKAVSKHYGFRPPGGWAKAAPDS